MRPYAEATTLDELLERGDDAAAAPIAELAPDVPPELIAIVEKAMARDPGERYPTAEGSPTDLRRFQAGKLVAAHHYTTGQLSDPLAPSATARRGDRAVALSC